MEILYISLINNKNYEIRKYSYYFIESYSKLQVNKLIYLNINIIEIIFNLHLYITQLRIN